MTLRDKIAATVTASPKKATRKVAVTTSSGARKGERVRRRLFDDVGKCGEASDWANNEVQLLDRAQVRLRKIFFSWLFVYYIYLLFLG